jgi:hypothetical protein
MLANILHDIKLPLRALHYPFGYAKLFGQSMATVQIKILEQQRYIEPPHVRARGSVPADAFRPRHPADIGVYFQLHLDVTGKFALRS